MTHSGEAQARADVFHRALWALPVVAAALVFSLLHGGTNSGFDPAMSRLATVYSLLNEGTFRIDLDANPFETRTIDKVMVFGEREGEAVAGGHLVSSKPPVLPLIMTAECVCLGLFGLDLGDPADEEAILAWLTATLVGAPWALALAYFALAVARLTRDPLSPALLTFALHFTTPCWGYSTTLNNHIPAAAAVIACWGLAAGVAVGRGRRPGVVRLLAYGFFASLVFALDLPGTILVVPPGLWFAWRSRWSGIYWLVLGAAPVLAVHFAATWMATGGLLPVQLRPEMYHYPGSYWNAPRAMDALDEPKAVYLFHMTLGRKGLLLLSPLLWLGVGSFVWAWMRRDAVWRKAVLSAGGAVVVLAAYYVLRTSNYGGSSYGFRWLIVAMPVLVLMAAPVMGRWSSGWRWGLLALLLAVGFYSAWESTQTVWAPNREWPTRFYGPSYEP